MRPPLAVAAVLAGAGSAAASTLHSAGFRSPSGNIRCFQFQGFLRCDQSHATNPAPRPKKPCAEGDFGFSFAVAARGRARRVCVSDAVPAVPGGPRLRYGRTWSRQGVTCRMRTSGLRCHNRSGHGFFTSTTRQYIF